MLKLGSHSEWVNLVITCIKTATFFLHYQWCVQGFCEP